MWSRAKFGFSCFFSHGKERYLNWYSKTVYLCLILCWIDIILSRIFEYYNLSILALSRKQWWKHGLLFEQIINSFRIVNGYSLLLFTFLIRKWKKRHSFRYWRTILCVFEIRFFWIQQAKTMFQKFHSNKITKWNPNSWFNAWFTQFFPALRQPKLSWKYKPYLIPADLNYHSLLCCIINE